MSISKIVVSGVIAVALFGATAASAQTYYPSYNTPSYNTSYTSGSCANISTTLSYGSTGTQVRALQSFLVSQNYPGSGSWMVTGFYGQATAAAVRDFQQAHGLPQTGSVDSSTLAAINGCGSTNYIPGLGATGYTTPNTYNQYPYNYNTYPTTNPYTYTYPTNYNYNNNYNYNTGCGTYPYYTPCNNYTYGTTPHLTSLSVTSATPGMQVTAYGTGFNPVANTVYVGGTTLSNIASFNNGSSLTFTIPANATNVISISVGNSVGTSNALTLSISGGPIVCGSYPYNTNCGTPIPPPCGSVYGYGYNCPPNTGVPTVSYLTPNSGGVGTAVTVYGSGFSTSGNTVHFGNGLIANLPSFDGYSVSFTVPGTLSGYGYQPVGLGTYNVSVSNSQGVSSNSVPFTITTLGTTGAATITSVNGPTNLGVGVNGTWSVTIQNPGNNYVTTSVSWGDTGNGYVNQAAPQTIYAQGATTVTFTHAYYAAGSYTISFTVGNGSGQQNTSSAMVYVSGTGSTSNISLTSLSPVSGPVGTQVVLQGTGFDALNNTVHFGVGGTMHVPAQNGVIYFTIPSYVSVCDVQSGTQCFAAQQVTPGSYQIYVVSPNGSSNTLNFQVQ